MTTALLPTPFLSPPLLNRRGQMPKLASPLVYCGCCEQPLIEVDINRHYCLLCDNYKCPLFRQSQDSREKPPEKPTPIKKAHSKPFNLLKPSYLAWLKKRKERYRLACNLGFNCKEAMLLRGKPKRQIKLLAERRVN